jgi:hypothetical protein
MFLRKNLLKKQKRTFEAQKRKEREGFGHQRKIKKERKKKERTNRRREMKGRKKDNFL